MTKYVVTGGAGFIGSHLVDFLLQATESSHILVYDNLRRGKLSNLSNALKSDRVEFIEGDIRDEATLSAACEGADTIFHLAAQSNVMGSVDDVDYSFHTNVTGTVHVLKSARAQKVRRIVFTSSREVYGEAQYTPVDENHPMGSKNSYGASKAAGELYCNVFYNNFGVETAIVRLGNVYGTRDFGRVIPLWLGWAHEGKDLIVYGGQQLIDFIYVDIVIEALWKAAHSEQIIGNPVNIASGQGTPILELAERILALIETESSLDRQPARSVEVVKFLAKVDKMRDVLRIEPPKDPLSHLADIVEAYKPEYA